MDNTTEGTTIEVLSWLSRATMDIIGTAGKFTSTIAFFEFDHEIPKALGTSLIRCATEMRTSLPKRLRRYSTPTKK